MKHIFSGAALVALSIFAAGCSSDDTTSAYDNNTITTFTGSSMGSEDPTTRSSMRIDELCEVGSPDKTLDLTRTSLTPVGSEQFDNPLYFHWDWGDVIYVKDDKNSWKKSVNPLKSKSQSADFHLLGVFLKDGPYTVHYVGNSADANKVTIKAAQSKVVIDKLTTHHIAGNGDCAVGTATKQANGKYKFTVTHKASYLLFRLFTTAGSTISDNYYTKQIKITSTKTIAGTYDFTNGSLANTPTNPSNVITFDGLYQGNLASAKTLGYRAESTYPYVIVIAPGTQQTLTVEYTLVNQTTNNIYTVKKIYKTKDFVENTYYMVDVDFGKLQ